MNWVCPSCLYRGKPKTVTKGNFGVEVMLWLFFLLPGLIYSVWRVSNKYKACPKCGNTGMIPEDSIAAKQLLTKYHTQEEFEEQKKI